MLSSKIGSSTSPRRGHRAGAVVALALALLLALASSVFATGGTVQWTRRYNGAGNGDDYGGSVAVSPDGTKVFVTGETTGATSDEDYTTVAYRAGTGAVLWTKHYNGPGNDYDSPYGIAVSPGGGRVFVTGTSTGTTSGEDYATRAYAADTGAVLWTRRYNGPGNAGDSAYAITVSPDGTQVFVTGISTGTTTGNDYATIAYRAGSGAVLWTKRYNGPADDFDAAYWVAVSPGGSRVVVTGGSTGTTSGSDYATRAYRADTGTVLWTKRYNGPGNGSDAGYSVAVTPNGATTIVTGQSTGASSGADYATIAYSTSSGAHKWTRRYNGPGNGIDSPRDMTLSPGGGRVFVTGQSIGATSNDDATTVAYRTGTGATEWMKRYNGPGNGIDLGYSIAVSPDGTRVFVAGESQGVASGYDYVTVAYGTTSGGVKWTKRYDGPAGGDDYAYSVAVGPGGTRVFVTGASTGTTSGLDFATRSYFVS